MSNSGPVWHGVLPLYRVAYRFKFYDICFEAFENGHDPANFSVADAERVCDVYDNLDRPVQIGVNYAHSLIYASGNRNFDCRWRLSAAVISDR